ncbi:unnamed protein product [Staurois parvus]|uniref:Uncharacterized protein n=1 Tax=Staurois parvus TaxID=386267 RepID=A0ABN9DFK2_9NEOB|nr:unnamed protein product [Staurois parvus]
MFCVLWETRYSECKVQGRPDIVNARSRETRYIVNAGSGRPDIVNAGSRGRPDIVNAGSGETRYSECKVQGDQI